MGLELRRPAACLHCLHRLHSPAQWKIQLGLDPSLEGCECLSDLPDWSFVDWCPTPSGKGQSHWKQDNDAFVRLLGPAPTNFYIECVLTHLNEGGKCMSFSL
uniref:Large ribosomal subunit protein mL52 n=1 Tax=Gopherus evgoodei TaxID=1825980 RepID=A0A8C4WI48_9SAUR